VCPLRILSESAKKLFSQTINKHCKKKLHCEKRNLKEKKKI
jgi:hypothetical protein